MKKKNSSVGARDEVPTFFFNIGTGAGTIKIKAQKTGSAGTFSARHRHMFSKLKIN
jgi:hypothetical protein